ncbi:tRNA-splicing endonuclease subunit sen54, partial [Ascosphaera aggregata]
MADADEDAMLRAGSFARTSTENAENDMSDETQDFRFLSSISACVLVSLEYTRWMYVNNRIISSSSDPNSATIPKRGEKDFEPNPTQLQSDILVASRQAMHNALSFTRLHNDKTVVRGIFCPDGVLIPREKIDAEE